MHSTISAVLGYDGATITGNERTEWSRYGALAMWVPMTQDRTSWRNLIQNHLACVRRQTWQYDTSDLGPPVLKDWGLDASATETVHV